MTDTDFSHRKLRNRDFRGKNLRGARFTGADLRGARFQGADLTGADFSGARLGKTFRGALATALLSFWIGLLAGFLNFFAGLILDAVIEEIPGIHGDALIAWTRCRRGGDRRHLAVFPAA
uniref:Pentapeptide repeat-containing protein n=1 Tax=Candidatus Kentrum sp. UNK TaxID=2126344 RepID=A0A451A081_9GAMM|nr:MAG: Pentapeptide repeat-containing protein [Candidatus Kentron sp. UNK]VFK68733.1 MAG: Pentapeptide repeat-containing protein [Candidatus Kentron sp. UNK]